MLTRLATGARRLGQATALVGPAALAVLAMGCAHAGPKRSAEVADRPSPSSVGLQAPDLKTQSLFRVRYQGDAGSGTLRLVLKIDDPSRYQIETKDRFGRAVWRLELSAGGTLLVDDRRLVHCTSTSGLRFPEIALESLPLRELPAILLGRLPGDLAPAGERDAGGEFRDADGRRWTVAAPGGRLEGWTVWAEGEPWLWWGREPSGDGVLSHRAGTQLRWKLIAKEPLAGDLAEMAASPDSRAIDCEAWPSAG